MTSITAEEETALNKVFYLLKSKPEESTSANSLVSVTNDDNIPAQREKLAVLVSTGNRKKLSACSSQMIRLNAFPTRTFRNTPKGMKPTSATRPLSL